MLRRAQGPAIAAGTQRAQRDFAAERVACQRLIDSSMGQSMMNSSEFKVFGIGLSKTGTSSLDLALNELGIRSIHFPSDWTTHRELLEGNYRLSILQQYQAATDIPIAPFYAQLDAIYPNSKFILTLRDQESWLHSVRHHWEFMWQWAEHDRHFREFLSFITVLVFGSHQFEPNRFREVYERHQNNVREYFRERPHDLLILDICSGQGWERLCPFLGLPVPARPFPVANRREEKFDREPWMQALRDAVRDFRAIVPAGERYALVDDQQLAGSELDDPARVRRLIERDGEYSGPPADGESAIAEIESLRQEGIPYLVIAWPCFWWLEHYPGLQAYLIDRYPRLLDNERLLVMDLRLPAAV
jgi:hypothetical protein